MTGYVYLRTQDLNGNKEVYQLPKDINGMVSDEYEVNRDVVKSLYKGALVTVPASRYTREGDVKLKVVKVLSVFRSNKQIYWRCRGQFVPYIRWGVSLDNLIGCFGYMRHDYTKINQARIQRDLLKWYKKEKGWIKPRKCS